MRIYIICLLLGLGLSTAHGFDLKKKYPHVNFISVAEPECIDPTRNFPVPINNPRAERYYRAAKKIDGQQDGSYFSQMFTLGRKAADLGDWRAKLFMAELYMNKDYNRLNPKQARIYLDELMAMGIPGAFYLMSQYRQRGGADFDNAPSPASVYLYESARLGDPRGMIAVANIFATVNRHQSGEKLIQCGIKYGQGAAAQDRAVSLYVNAGIDPKMWQEAFYYNYLAAVAGDSDGLFSISSLESRHKYVFGKHFAPDAQYAKRANQLWFMTNPGFWHDDPYRKKQGLPFRVKGNPTYKLPNLNKVLPFPPTAKLPAWNGDFSVLLSEEDAKEYRTNYNYDRLVKEVLIDGQL